MLNAEQFLARIENATPAELIVITYEILLSYIEEAKQIHEWDDDAYRDNIQRAQAALENLMDGLDMQYEISRSFFSLYVYINKQLMQAYFCKKPELLDECSGLLTELLDGWKQAIEKDPNPVPLEERSQQVFAGLTYGRGGKLNEYIEEDRHKSFKA